MITKNFYSLTKQQTSIIKGVAIIMIVMHNYLHLFGFGENEMSFDFSILFHYLKGIAHQPDSFPNAMFSYFGHYGVQLFIFVSGFGLAKKYLQSDNQINYKEYYVYRIAKIYSYLLFGLLITVCHRLVMRKLDFTLFLGDALRTLSMTDNFSYHRLFAYVGPWWFFSMILQLYILFPFLYKYIQQRQRKGFYILLLVSYLLIYLLLPITEHFSIPLFGNCIGHLPEFVLGIAVASIPEIKIQLKHILIVVVVFIFSNLSKYAFPLSFLCVTIILLLLVYPLLNKKNKLVKFLIFIGEISAFMFVINGQLRALTMKPFIAKAYNPLLLFSASILHLFLTIAIAYGMSIVYRPIWSFFQKLIHRLTAGKAIR